MVKKIVVIGPESTGKSTLCKQLAEHYNTMWCPEYAREFLNQNGIKYVYDDLKKIAEGQLAIEDYLTEELLAQNSKLKTENSLLFIDTNMYVMKVWYEYVYAKCEYLILDEIAGRQYDLYLLCNIDLPWVEEEMREYPDIQSRTKLYAMYKEELTEQKTPWVEISGNYYERFEMAVKACNKFLCDFKLNL